jgi:hypothetical protein
LSCSVGCLACYACRLACSAGYLACSACHFACSAGFLAHKIWSMCNRVIFSQFIKFIFNMHAIFCYSY